MTDEPNPYESPQEPGRRIPMHPWVKDRLLLLGCGTLAFFLIFVPLMLGIWLWVQVIEPLLR